MPADPGSGVVGLSLLGREEPLGAPVRQPSFAMEGWRAGIGIVLLSAAWRFFDEQVEEGVKIQ
jgi:hypothetical protein